MSIVVWTLMPPRNILSLPKRSSSSWVTASVIKGDLLLRQAVGFPTNKGALSAACSSSGVIQLRVCILANTDACLALVLL